MSISAVSRKENKNRESRFPDWVNNDCYWLSALTILVEMAERDSKIRLLMQSYIDWDERTIKFTSMKKSTAAWSHNERIMIALAAHLFNERYAFNLSELDCLDRSNKELAMEAIRFRFDL